MKDIFSDKKLRTGGFYELAIEVCPSIDTKPIKLYTDYIWTLENVNGPFDADFNLTQKEFENARNEGIIKLNELTIPFVTLNIREESPIETGSNWFDICFYTSAIEKVFGSEYKTWTEKPNVPNELKNFFRTTLEKLYELYPFRLALIDFEISGMCYFDDLKKPLTNNLFTNTTFIVGKDCYEQIATDNRECVTIIDENYK